MQKKRHISKPISYKFKRHRRLYLCILLLVLLLAAVSTKLRITKIDCVTQFSDCSENIYNSLSTVKGGILYHPRLASRVKSLLSLHPEIKKAKLTRNFPNYLLLELTTRKPLGALYTSSESQKMLIDDNGEIYHTASTTSLPLLQVSTLPQVTDFITENQLLALKRLAEISSLQSRPLIARITNSTLEIDYQPGLILIVDVQDPVEKWSSPLQLILLRSKINSKQPHKIDLRFTNPIVTY